jgi:hypothetical protein
LRRQFQEVIVIFIVDDGRRDDELVDQRGNDDPGDDHVVDQHDRDPQRGRRKLDAAQRQPGGYP